MRRLLQIPAVLAAAAVTAFVAGCGPKEEGPATQASPAAAPQNVSTEEKAVPAVGKDGAPP